MGRLLAAVRGRGGYEGLISMEVLDRLHSGHGREREG